MLAQGGSQRLIQVKMSDLWTTTTGMGGCRSMDKVRTELEQGIQVERPTEDSSRNGTSQGYMEL